MVTGNVCLWKGAPSTPLVRYAFSARGVREYMDVSTVDGQLSDVVPLVDVIQIMVAAFPDQVMEGIRKDEYLYAK